ncbi:hypothetical protein [Marinicella meishanensis]|uniref:hypothetical protein n=1 Tax=Marinicella meishanensis TaxID=2873263 RepID=UPI001CBF6401|nr:hypothetical protein [Marinicella sp. NBU2979]
MKFSNKLIQVVGMLMIASFCQAAGTISGPGWYYQAVPVGVPATYVNIFLKGAYADKTSCQSARSDDADPSDGIIPLNWGPRCHYIYASDVQNANDLYEVAFNPGSDPIIGLSADQQIEYFSEIDQINQEHGIRSYREKVNRLIASYRQNQQPE